MSKTGDLPQGSGANGPLPRPGEPLPLAIKPLSELAQPVFDQVFGAVGDDAPAQGRSLVAVHCSLAHSGAWRGLAAALGTQGLRLRAFDLLSHGRSPDWDGQGMLQLRNAEAGLAILAQEAERSGAPVDLIGHSFGATVALAMACAAPDLVASLVLIEPVLFAAAASVSPELFAAQRAEHAPIQAMWQAGDVETATRVFNRAWGSGRPRWPDLPASARAGMIRAFPSVMACDSQIYHDAAGLLAEGRPEALQMPRLILAGSESPAIMAAVQEGLAQRMPGAQAAVVQGAGHMLPVTHPQETAVRLQALLRR